MAEADRLRLIKAIEDARQSRVITVVTGDRRGHETRIAWDMVPLVIDHLREIGNVERIDLFLYTPGGDQLAAVAIANAVRNGRADIVEILLRHDVNANIENDDGQTPLEIATKEGRDPIAELLRRYTGR